MRAEPNPFALWVRAELVRRYEEPTDMPAELLALVDKACTRA